jgi:hypothetical protein
MARLSERGQRKWLQYEGVDMVNTTRIKGGLQPPLYNARGVTNAKLI